jgi:hypothetical protein
VNFYDKQWIAMKRIVIFHDNVSELLQDILSHRHDSCYLIICSTKKHFRRQLVSSLDVWPTTETNPVDDNGYTAGEGGSEQIIEPHALLNPTLDLLSRSKASRFAFCPTIDTLRAYLATFASKDRSQRDSQASCLLILDLVKLHHATSEFSVQGLMRTLASAVEAAARNHLDLRLCECKDVHNVSNPGCGPGLWNVQVPVLSGSVRARAENTSQWSQRTMAVRSIVGRWFDFEPQETAVDVSIEDDGEMLV